MKNFRQLFWLLAAGLLASLLVNGILLSQLRALYAARWQAEISPAGLPVTPVIAGTTTNFSATILLYGDSRMAVWDFPPPPGTRLVNAAIGGTTTAQLRLRLPALLAEFQPDLVVVQAGINDLKLLGVKPELAADLISQTATNLAALTQIARQQHAKTLLLLTWPPGAPEWRRRLVWNPHIAEAVTRLNARLPELVTGTDVAVVDLLAQAGVKPVAADYRDALHFQPDVYRRLTPVLEQALNKFRNQH